AGSAGAGAPGEAGGFPGSIVKSWWRSRYPYEGAAGFGLMREEMLIKSNAQQVLACDPEDMIVAEASSAKAGVSVMVELGDHPSSLDVYEPPKAYKVADHLRTCPPVERMSLPLCPQERLTAVQIAHF
ncbi:unnamed protein product, partial [Hapterophycus canaliculatus]